MANEFEIRGNVVVGDDGRLIVEAEFSPLEPSPEPLPEPIPEPTPEPEPEPEPEPLPSGSVMVNPGSNIQALVNNHPPGTPFIFRDGRYHDFHVNPKSNQQFIAENSGQVILSGALPLDQWVQDGKYWRATRKVSLHSTQGACLGPGDACHHPEQLFMAGQRLEQVFTKASVGLGQWFYDHGTGNVFVVDKPDKPEFSTQSRGFGSTGDRIFLGGLILEKYGCGGQVGAISGHGRTGWVLEEIEARLNHAMGAVVHDKGVMRRCKFHDNGQGGMRGRGDNLLVVDTDTYNNGGMFDPNWDAGGCKFVRTDGMIFRRVRAWGNVGPGLWTDIDNIRTTYEECEVWDNTQHGIFHEISMDCLMDKCIAKNNGGIGLYNSSSANVEVRGSTAIKNGQGAIAARQQVDLTDSRGSGPNGIHEVRNYWVHDNEMDLGGKPFVGLVGKKVLSKHFSNAFNNRYDRNRYQGASGTPFRWDGKNVDWAGWRQAGMDPSGESVR